MAFPFPAGREVDRLTFLRRSGQRCTECQRHIMSDNSICQYVHDIKDDALTFSAVSIRGSEGSSETVPSPWDTELIMTPTLAMPKACQ